MNEGAAVTEHLDLNFKDLWAQEGWIFRPLRMQFSIQEIQHLGPGLRLSVRVRLGSAT